MAIYEHHVVGFEPGRLAEVTSHVRHAGAAAVAAKGGQLFGVWKPLIGLSLNHTVAVTRWPDDAAARANANTVLAGCKGLTIEQHALWVATLRPKPDYLPANRPGYVTHRWYDIRESDLAEFLEHSGSAWGSWEGTHDGEVLGLWRTLAPPAPGRIRMRLMAWYRDLGVWERSRYWKGTKGAETANQRLGARYALNLDSAVSILESV